jgi:drug/metabolite transporter (DMT)-like permease
MTPRGRLLFGSMCVIWGIPYLLIRVAVRDLSPAALVCSRTALAALILLPLAGWRGELRPVVGRFGWVALFALVEVALPWLLLSSAERRISSSLSGLMIAAVPLVGAVIARASGSRERLGAASIAGLAVGLAGVAALVGLDLGAASPAALTEIAFTVLGYALGPAILARRLNGEPALGVISVALALTAVCFAPFALTSLPARVPPVHVLAAVATLALVCTALAFVLFFALIEEIGPVRATVITYVNPAVALALGIGLLGERFTAGMGVGFCGVLVGSVLATRGPPAAAPAALATEGGR